MFTRKRIVIALGGNALGNTLPEQMVAVKTTAKALCDLIEEGHQVVVVHGNGPQVGMINNAMSALSREDENQPNTPLSVCVAMSQAYIGYDLQNAIRTELLNRGIYKTVSTVLTQVVVDPYDEAFYHPTKVIGRVMTKEEAEEEDEIVENSAVIDFENEPDYLDDDNDEEEDEIPNRAHDEEDEEE